MINSIEFSHVYMSDEEIREPKRSSKECKRVITDLENAGESYQLAVMIDDYSGLSSGSFNYPRFMNHLRDLSLTPNLVLFEGNLIKYNRHVVNKMPQDLDLAKQLNSILENGKHPCSLFIATWYMIRLGLLDIKQKDVVYQNDFKPSSRLINILDRDVLENEIRASRILRLLNIPYSYAITNIYL